MKPFADDSSEIEQSPISHPSVWPTDRIHVGLQAILLESAGYTVPEAVIYYAEEKLRLSISVDDSLKTEALITLENAKRCAEGSRPLPLLNDARCQKCSLQPVCLPDEVNQQRAQSLSDEFMPRKIWPPRDDGIHVVAQQDGVKVGVRGMELRISEKNGSAVKTIPLANLESLSLLGSVQITTQAISTLADMKIPIAILSRAGRLVAMIDPLDSVSAEVRRSQIRKLDCKEVCLELARALISAKIINQRTLLLRNHGSLPTGVAADLAKEAKNAARADSLDAVRGHEGQAAAIYFRNFSGMFKGPLSLEFDANGRKRRPPPDPINSCLSLSYSMLTHECVAALRLARLEPSIGGFHISKPGRPALALDLMEPFRPLIADSAVLTAVNTRMVTTKDFLVAGGAVSLTPEGRKAFFRAYEQRMDTLVTHPIFGYRISYRRILEVQTRLLARWLNRELANYSAFVTR